MDFGFKEKVAIVSGAGGDGIGTGICLLLAREGANVVANDLDGSRADKVASQVSQLGVRSLATYADVTKLQECEEMVQKTLSEFGRVDILITVPAFTAFREFMDTPAQVCSKELDITFFGVLNSVRAVLQPMLQQRKGTIVCISSESSKIGVPRVVVYGAAKAAVNQFASGLAKEVGRFGIRINTVCPWYVKTPKAVDTGWLTPEIEQEYLKAIPLGRLAETEDVVNVIAFLASELASYVTGQSISINGGLA